MGGAQSPGVQELSRGASCVQLAAHPAPPFAPFGRTTPPGTETFWGWAAYQEMRPRIGSPVTPGWSTRR